jgi:hypothetical protein
MLSVRQFAVVLTMGLLQETVESYKLYLEVTAPSHLKRFKPRLKTDENSAISEAAILARLRDRGYRAKVAENLSTGGPDFLCFDGNSPFFVEVTCVSDESVTQNSGLENFIPNEVSAGSFTMITDKLKSISARKTPQVAVSQIPRLIVITSLHIHASLVLGVYAAERLLTGETQISVGIGARATSRREVRTLRNSVFFRFSKDGHVEPCRRSISAGLLAHIHSDGASIVSVLHPSPIQSLPSSLFRTVPMVRASNWPFENGIVEAEWIIREPFPCTLVHRPVTFADDELKEP